MYYPKSQIKTGLVSNGTLAIKSTNEPYFGKYFATSNGNFYVGPTPSNELIELILLDPTPSEPTFEPSDMGDEGLDLRFGTKTNYKYSSAVGLSPQSPNPYLPSTNYPTPTKDDYSIGEFQRYFCKKNNELIYLEIDKDTYNKLSNNDPQILFDLYTPISTPWSLTGTPQSVFNTNKNIITLIERNKKWYGFTNYFQDKFSEYYLEE
tara:strand:- start:11706 stop:12326 length:621 start_codon:yes stop_codon:yes gene_type:complete